jgi:DNA-binding LytR/AlgR family response regulator
MINIAICDDNLDELSKMVHLLEQYRVSKHLNCEYAVFHNGFELISAIEKGKLFDMYCLDIIMPALTGIEVAEEIRDFDKNATILFFTSSTEYALDSYSVNALNYVLKPITKDIFFFVFDKVLERLKIEQDDAIIVKSKEGIQRILIPNLVYVEVMGRNVFYHLISGKVLECTEAFASVCDNLLKHRCFIKTHRSYIVNMQYIDAIDNNSVTLQTLSSTPIAQGKARVIKERYLAFQMEEE